MRHPWVISQNDGNCRILMLPLFLLIGFSPLVVLSCLQLVEDRSPVLFCQASVPRLPLPPQSIPPNISKLRIIGTNQTGSHNGLLTRFNLTGLETLSYLKISKFEVHVIETDTFREMRQLRVLDLSGNRISVIQPGAFNGLHLDLLSLSENADLVMRRGLFRGAQVSHLAVRNCGLQEIDYEIIAETNPKQLTLSHNRITWLDPRFKKILKPWDSFRAESSNAVQHNWGLIDLTNNPLNCNCQLMWLPRVIEELLYETKSAFLPVKREDADNRRAGAEVTSVDVQARMMHQLNLTCASPSSLFGKRLPRSWDFFCPTPRVVGIDVNIMTEQADYAQLTCIGEGQPVPSLAWSYRVGGQTVQRMLDPSAKRNFIDNKPTPSEPLSNQMIERRLSLNVSLKEPVVNNLTCTVWNDDNLMHDFANPADQAYSSKPAERAKSLSIPSLGGAHQLYRMHEVMVRVFGPVANAKPPITDQNQVAATFITATTEATSTNHTVRELNTDDPIAVNQLGQIDEYGYLFVKRFTLLELLGAIFGTFVVTLALLCIVTQFLSWFCQFQQIPAKEFPRSQQMPTKQTLFGWLKRNKAHSTSTGADIPSRDSSERAPLSDFKSFNPAIADSAFSMMTSATNRSTSTPGPSTVCHRNQGIPPTLLLTSVPLPQTDRGPTPPPNPAYWPAPEYTYSGAGSHEYDIPRPLEPIIGGKGTMRAPFLPTNVSGQLQQLSEAGGHSAATLSALPSAQWMHMQTPNAQTLNPLLTWGPLGAGALNLVNHHQEPHLTNGTYMPYPPSQSIAYSADYPTYLQTRPYPHHQHQTQPMLEFMTNLSQQAVPGMQLANTSDDHPHHKSTLPVESSGS